MFHTEIHFLAESECSLGIVYHVRLTCLTLFPWHLYCGPVHPSDSPVTPAPGAAAALCVYGPESSATLQHRDTEVGQRTV